MLINVQSVKAVQILTPLAISALDCRHQNSLACVLGICTLVELDTKLNTTHRLHDQFELLPSGRHFKMPVALWHSASMCMTTMYVDVGSMTLQKV